MIGLQIPRAATRASKLGRLAALTGAAVLVVSAAVAALPASAATGSGGGCATTLASGSTRSGHLGGIVRPQRIPSAACAGPVAGDPHNSGGSPPLINHGGPMMGTPATATRSW